MKRRVPVEALRSRVDRLVAEHGHEEAARRIGITPANLYFIRSGKTKTVQQPTARGILLASWRLPRLEVSVQEILRVRICGHGACTNEATSGDWCPEHTDPADRWVANPLRDLLYGIGS